MREREIKVLLVGSYPPPPGGIAIHLAQLRAFLLSRGIRTGVLDIGKTGRAHDGVLPVRSRLSYALRLAQYCARGWLIHLHVTGDNRMSWAATASVVAASKIFRSPALVTLHSGFVPDYLAGSARRRRNAAALLSRCSRVIAVSDAIASALTAAGVPPSVVVAHPAFLASQLKPSAPPEGFESARAMHQPLLSMADHPSEIYGRGVAFKALRLLVDRFPSAGLALFGPRPRDRSVRSQAVAEGVADRVHDFGELDHSVALALMSRCDAFLRPTAVDGDALTVREALCLGIRCVASDAAHRPEAAVLFRVGDFRDLAEKVADSLSRRAAGATAIDVGPALLSEYQAAYGAGSDIGNRHAERGNRLTRGIEAGPQ
jgi:hypothetical protein